MDRIQKEIKNHPFLRLSEITYISPQELVPHPERDLFPPMPPEQRELLIESIRKDGILHNLVVADRGLLDPDKYTILSGHNRWEIALSLHIPEIPCKIVTLTEEVRQFLTQKDVYNLFLEIFLEANLAQRILDPATYVKCLERRGEALIRVEREKLFDRLIPEFREALQRKEIPLQLARVLSRFSFEEQRNFISLIGGKYGKIQSADLETLKRILEEKKTQLSSVSRQLDELRRRNFELQKQIESLTSAKERDKRMLKSLTQEKRNLLKRISELEEKLSGPHEKIPPKLVADIESLRRSLLEKDREIERLQRHLAETERETERLRNLLEQEKRKAQEEVARVQEEFRKRLEAERAENRRASCSTGFSPPYQRYRVFLESVLSIMDEIRGDRDLGETEKKALVSLLRDLIDSARMTIGILENRSPEEILGLGKPVISEEEGDFSGDFGEQGEPEDLYEEYLRDSV